MLFKKLEQRNIKRFTIPSIFSIITGLLFLLNNYGWKLPLINPYLIEIPNIEGDYEGSVEILHLDSPKKDTARVKVVIKQTGTSTTLDLYSEGGSHTKSIIADLIKSNDVWYLYSYYSNENYSKPENRNRYDGASKAEIGGNTKNEVTIKGQFFNDETRKSFGTINLKLLH